MIKRYPIKSICLKRGIITELEPGLYPLDLATDTEHLTDRCETVTYINPVSEELVTMPPTQFRRVGKLNRMYANWDGEKLQVAGAAEFPLHLKMILDNGYCIKTEEHMEHLKGQGFTPISLTEFYIEHGIPLEREIKGTVYTNREAAFFFRNLPGEDGLFIKLVKEGDIIIPFTKLMTPKKE